MTRSSCRRSRRASSTKPRSASCSAGGFRRATESEALAAIAGVTCVNDVTARDIQRSEEQWTRGKGFDTFCPVGPRVVAVDPARMADLEIRCRVNGVERQHGYARDMAFGFAALVAYASQAMTLEPGDLIAPGTPPGVGPLTAAGGPSLRDSHR